MKTVRLNELITSIMKHVYFELRYDANNSQVPLKDFRSDIFGVVLQCDSQRDCWNWATIAYLNESSVEHYSPSHNQIKLPLEPKQTKKETLEYLTREVTRFIERQES